MHNIYKKNDQNLYVFLKKTHIDSGQEKLIKIWFIHFEAVPSAEDTLAALLLEDEEGGTENGKKSDTILALNFTNLALKLVKNQNYYDDDVFFWGGLGFFMSYEQS